MERILASMAIISALGFGYYADDIAHGTTVAVYQMGDEFQSAYSFFRPDVRTEAKKCLDWNKQELTEGRVTTSDYCRDMVRQWRELDGDAAPARYFAGVPSGFKPIDFSKRAR